MAQPQVLLLNTLDHLGDDDFEGFKWYLKNTFKIPVSKLGKADRRDTVDLMVQSFPRQAVDMTIACLREINRSDLVEHLSQNNAGGKNRLRRPRVHRNVA